MTRMNDSDSVKLYVEHIYIYRDDVHRIIKSVIGDEHDTDDLTQMVMINAWKGLSTLKDVKKSKAWVKAITRNVIRAHMKKKIVHISVEEMDLVNDIENHEELHQLETDILDMLVTAESYGMIGKALRSLEPVYQTIIREHVIGDVPLKEIARLHDIKYGTVRVMYSRGLRMLKDAYQKLERGGGLNG